MSKKEESYVIVVNRSGPIPLRHIVSITTPWDKDSFTAWYYSQYHKLAGDDFIFCADREERDRGLQSLDGQSGSL